MNEAIRAALTGALDIDFDSPVPRIADALGRRPAETLQRSQPLLGSPDPFKGQKMNTNLTLTLESPEQPALRATSSNGRAYVGGDQGQRYSIRLTNNIHRRVCVVVTVDGINVNDAKPGSYDGQAIIVNANSSVLVEGWRKDLGKVAAFRIGTPSEGYAASQGAAGNEGVIGAAVFEEKRAPRREAYRGGGLESMHTMSAGGPMRGGAATGFGEDVASAVTMVDFQRASARPAAVHAIYYDLTSALIERGILQTQGSEPDPFPASSAFCPSPY